MQIVAAGYFLRPAIYENTDKRRPHIDEIQAVEAMGDDQNIRRKGCTVGMRATDGDDERACKTAKCRVKKRAGKATERKIIGDELAGTCKNIP